MSNIEVGGQLKPLFKLLELLIVSSKNYKIKNISLNTANDLFSTEDGDIPELRNFDGINNYYTITFNNYDQLSIGDFNEYQIDSDNEINRQIEQINEILEENSFSLKELNSFIKLIINTYKI